MSVISNLLTKDDDSDDDDKIISTKLANNYSIPKPIIADSSILLSYYNLFNSKVFNSLLGPITIVYVSRLVTTAGRYLPLENRIELSPSLVAGSSTRLQETLLHEMCHAAQYIQGERDTPHGMMFKKWSSIAMTHYPELSISVCHNYI